LLQRQPTLCVEQEDAPHTLLGCICILCSPYSGRSTAQRQEQERTSAASVSSVNWYVPTASRCSQPAAGQNYTKTGYWQCMFACGV
jgi:hypothetical protein